MRRVVDEMALNQALTATVEREGSYVYVRIRPHQPGAYFASQAGSVVLSTSAINGLRDLLERNGLILGGER